jgi:hypothetical protein
MPTTASASAMEEKTPSNIENSRWRLDCESRSMAALRVTVPLKLLFRLDLLRSVV